MEENKSGDNGKLEEQKPQFKHFVKIFFNDETGEFASEVKVTNLIIGYGMLEFGKKSVEAHIVKMQERNVAVPAKGGIMNFARGIKR